MAIRPARVPGLPDNISVQRSDRRRKTVSASVENGVTVVVVPSRMPVDVARKYAIELHEKIAQKQSRRNLVNDDDLFARAQRLRTEFLPEGPTALSVTWSSRQNRRWGSCTPSDRTIRISDRLQHAPDYVVNYVLLHELAHLIVGNHSKEFEALVQRYPKVDEARAFLEGIEFGQTNT